MGSAPAELVSVFLLKHSNTQETIGYTRVNNRVPPAWIELLIHEKSQGKSLRQLG